MAVQHQDPRASLLQQSCITYDAEVRTTTDLPPAIHRRARELAAERGQSLSTVIADLTARGLASLGEPVQVSVDTTTGLPSITLGRAITSEDVAAILDDE